MTPTRLREPGPTGAGAAAATSGGHVRVRTCAGCGEHIVLETRAESRGPETIHFVVGPDGEVAVDASGHPTPSKSGSRSAGSGRSEIGRGAHVHATPRCLEQAVARGLPRSFRRSLKTADGTWGNTPVARMVISAFDRRVEGLLISAKRSKALALGGDAVTREIDAGTAKLLVVACDAAAAADLGAVRRFVSGGNAVAWGDKTSLARLLRATSDRGGEAPPLAVIAITDHRLADAVRRSVLAREAATLLRDSARGRPNETGQADGRQVSPVVERGA
jgi:hypothetical protein